MSADNKSLALVRFLPSRKDPFYNINRSWTSTVYVLFARCGKHLSGINSQSNVTAELVKRLVSSFRHPFELVKIFSRYSLHTVLLILYGFNRRKTCTKRELTILPRRPLPCYTIWGIAQVLGLKLVTRPVEKGILWLDVTTISPHESNTKCTKAINSSCRNIKKSFVSSTYQNVFKRSIDVDPKSYRGLIVQKSEINGAHDGRILSAPLISPRSDCCYQKLIDNRTQDGMRVVDERVVIVGNMIPLVYRKERSIEKRFESSSIQTKPLDPNDVFSSIEQRQISHFAKEIGMEFGELDIIRDKSDGNIYIVDANKTSIAPPINLSFSERLAALKIVGAAFEKEFF